MNKGRLFVAFVNFCLKIIVNPVFHFSRGFSNLAP